MTSHDIDCSLQHSIIIFRSLMRSFKLINEKKAKNSHLQFSIPRLLQTDFRINVTTTTIYIVRYAFTKNFGQIRNIWVWKKFENVTMCNPSFLYTYFYLLFWSNSPILAGDWQESSQNSPFTTVNYHKMTHLEIKILYFGEKRKNTIKCVCVCIYKVTIKEWYKIWLYCGLCACACACSQNISFNPGASFLSLRSQP